MKKGLSILSLLLIAVVSFAVPAKRISKNITLADGKQITMMLMGDEHCHWYESEDGQRYILNEKDQAVRLTANDFCRMMERQQERRDLQHAKRNLRLRNREKRAFGEQSNAFIGEKKGLVILVEYPDMRFRSANTPSVFSQRFNEPGYNDNGYVGSVHDYFYDQSYGQFDLSFDIIGPVTLSQNYSYYGQNDSYGDDLHPCEMVIETLNLVDEEVDFSKYDWDGDGNIEQVFIIYAGHGEAQGGQRNTIWPHEWELSSGAEFGDGDGAQTIDGVTIDTYAVSCELAGGSGSVIDGIGTACHEFSHCLGMPDTYDTSYSGGPGMIDWDIMAHGEYMGPSSIGEVPVAYTAYERMFAGWLKPTVLDSPCVVDTLHAITSYPHAYIIYNDANTNEYYLLENRQLEKWDTYTGGHGMLVTHIDYDETAWTENEVNNDKNRQRITFIPADGSYGNRTGGTYRENAEQKAGDTYPGILNNENLTDSSYPAASLNTPSAEGEMLMGKPIEEIKESEEGVISFIFMGGESDENPDLIKDVYERQSLHAETYSIAGQKVSDTYHGIYIYGGKKHVTNK